MGIPPDGPVGIVGEGPDEMEGDEGVIRLTGVVAFVDVSCTAERVGGAAPQDDVSGRLARSWQNDPLPPLML